MRKFHYRNSCPDQLRVKKLIDLPDFTIVSCHELENGWVFQLLPSKQCPICPVCFGKTQRHAVIHRRLRHTFA
jgi:transposase